jgi:hypothetical protein
MSDNPLKRGRKDRIRINLEQFHEVQYWSKKFGCTTAELRQVVAQVGSSAHAVEHELNRRHPPIDARQAHRHRPPGLH